MIGRFILFALAALPAGTAFGQQALAGDAGAARPEPVVSEHERVEIPPATAKAMQYYWSGNILWIANTALGLAVPALFLVSGLSGGIGRLAKQISKYWYFTIVIYFILFSLLTYLIGLPLSFYQEFVRQHAYGLSNQTLAKWASDSLLGLLVGIVGGTLLLWIPYLLLKKSPRRWWLYTSILSVPCMFFVMLIQPVFIAPLFNVFGEMSDKQLEAKILKLAGRAGIEGGRVFEVNKRVDTQAVNAYVTGFAGTKRIVLWDTLLEKLDEDEVLYVMGHEMGHYVLGHIVSTILISSVIICLGLYFVHKTADGFIEKFHRRIGFNRLHDIASLPLIILLANIYGFAAAPVLLAVSRYNEHEADRFGLELTRQNHAAASAFAKLQQENLGNPRPGPLFVLWRATHPSLGSRINFCNDYRPWEEGEPLIYEHLY